MASSKPQALPQRLTTVDLVHTHEGYECFSPRFVRKLIERDRIARFQPEGKRTKVFVSLDDLDAYIAGGRIEAGATS